MGKNIICRNAISSYDGSARMEVRARLIDRQYPQGSRCISKDDLIKIGCDLQADLQANGIESLPRKFVDIGRL